MDKIKKKIHGFSDSDGEKPSSSSSSSLKSKVFRLFGREKPLHQVFGGGKPADVFLWRNKKISGGALALATVIWISFELLEYHFLTLICHVLILILAGLFLWSNATTFINKKAQASIPEVSVPEKLVLQFVSALIRELNQAISTLREIASGREISKFISVIAGLWVLSSVGSCFNFLTLAYIVFVLLHTVPVLYEKYEDRVDSLSEKAIIELKKKYKVLDAKVLSKIPKGAMKDKKKV